MCIPHGYIFFFVFTSFKKVHICAVFTERRVSFASASAEAKPEAASKETQTSSTLIVPTPPDQEKGLQVQKMPSLSIRGSLSVNKLKTIEISPDAAGNGIESGNVKYEEVDARGKKDENGNIESGNGLSKRRSRLSTGSRKSETSGSNIAIDVRYKKDSKASISSTKRGSEGKKGSLQPEETFLRRPSRSSSGYRRSDTSETDVEIGGVKYDKNRGSKGSISSIRQGSDSKKGSILAENAVSRRPSRTSSEQRKGDTSESEDEINKIKYDSTRSKASISSIKQGVQGKKGSILKAEALSRQPSRSPSGQRKSDTSETEGEVERVKYSSKESKLSVSSVTEGMEEKRESILTEEPLPRQPSSAISRDRKSDASETEGETDAAMASKVSVSSTKQGVEEKRPSETPSELPVLASTAFRDVMSKYCPAFLECLRKEAQSKQTDARSSEVFDSLAKQPLEGKKEKIQTQEPISKQASSAPSESRKIILPTQLRESISRYCPTFMECQNDERDRVYESFQLYAETNHQTEPVDEENLKISDEFYRTYINPKGLASETVITEIIADSGVEPVPGKKYRLFRWFSELYIHEFETHRLFFENGILGHGDYFQIYL